jgi:hypothetical protein
VPLQLNAIPSSQELHHHHHLNLNQQQQQQHIFELIDIPPPRELDLSLIPKPANLKLDEICVPPPLTSTKKLSSSILLEGSIKIPKSKSELIELVSANGDGYEENLIIKCNKKDDLDSSLG